MNLVEFVKNLSAQGVELWGDGDQLCYRAPKDALTSTLLTQIKQHKTEILQLLRDRADNSKAYPLSHGQRALWFLHQLAPESTAYNIIYGAYLDSDLDILALQKSFETLFERHPLLCNTYGTKNGEPFQQVQKHQKIHFKVKNASNWSQDDFNTWLAQEADRPFDLEQEPLLRINLLTQFSVTDTLGAKKTIFFVTAHHIIIDFWSLEILIDELSVLYEATKTGKIASLLPQSLQYQDYVRWEAQMLTSPEGERLWAYWQKQLAGELPVLNLPTDRPRPPIQTYCGTSLFFELNDKLTSRLRELAKGEEATLYMTLMTAFLVLLLRYTNQEDILIGSPVAGRSLAEFERIVGYFVNPLVLRVNLSKNPTFQELLRRVRRVVLEALEHQQYPFPLLVEQLQSIRNLSRPPLCQVVFVWDQPRQRKGLLADFFVLEQRGAAFDLNLTILDTGGSLKGGWEYNTDLFNSETITRMNGHFQTLLEAIVANPLQQISSLPLLTATERHQMLVEWNDTQSKYPQEKCIHQLFEAQVERTPDAIAVVFEDQFLTYRELNSRANQLAHHLQVLGIGSDVLVGICVERSLEMLVGVLAIFKAGGAYVPIDPTYPLERQSFILEDVQPLVLLTQERLIEKLPSHSAQVVCLDSDWEAIKQESQKNPNSGVTHKNLAYTIYTSGSTGKPKGVLVAHQGLCNLVTAQIQTFNVQPSSCVLQFASFSFDASISEIVMTLCSGARLCLGTAESLLPGSVLIKLLHEQAITHVTLPPSVLAVLPSEKLPALQTIIVAGEACGSDLVAQWSADRRFFNAYGPTESTVCATVALCTDGSQKPFIGHPIANIKIYILDCHQQPVPIGVPGELHIGGVALGWGYLNRPELTAEKFIPNPFSDEPGARLYKTGDLARYLSEGNIEFLDRIDRQVKIRGYRIEPREIEAVLTQNPDVQEAVVIAKEDHLGNKGLVAYVVPDVGHLNRLQEQDNQQTGQIELWPSVAEYYVYDEFLYYAMTNDQRRNHSYKVAINQSVKDKIVVEIGTGKDAILSRFCVEAGARKVYAIERNQETCRLAEASIQKLGLSDKISVIHGDATLVDLPELAEVCVSEIVGPIGGCEGAAVIINNARRFLKQDGVMIPSRSLTKIAAVCLPDQILDNPRFTNVSGHYTQKIFEQVGYPFDLRVCIKNFPKSNLLSNTDIFEDLDFTKPVSTESSHEVNFIIDKDGRLDGFLLWLNLQTIEGEVIDILEYEYCWLPVYFPAFQPGIEVSVGDTIKAVCTRVLCENNLNQDYAIKGELLRKNGQAIEFEHISYQFKKMFKQTPFYQRLFADDEISNNSRRDNLAQSLRGYLKEILPNYMVPHAFVMLNTLPLTSNGKVNRHALPAPEMARSGVDATYAAPQTETERLIAAVWQEKFQIEKVGIYDNFFDLGGHSLLIVQIHTKLQEIFDRDLSIVDLFKYPTISSLTKYFSQEATKKPAFKQSEYRSENRIIRQDSINQRSQFRHEHRAKKKTRGIPE